MTLALTIGAPVYQYDGNRRRYDKSRLIYREHFTPGTVTGETRDSWLVLLDGYREPRKYAKDDGRLRVRDNFGACRIVTPEIMEAECWDHAHREAFVDFLRQNPGATKRAADALGWEPTTPTPSDLRE